MGGSTTMEKRGHHMCRMAKYEVRQKITQETTRKVGGKFVKTPGSVEVMIYEKKNKIEGGMTDITLTPIIRGFILYSEYLYRKVNEPSIHRHINSYYFRAI